MGAVLLSIGTGIAVAQNPTPAVPGESTTTPMSVPRGYTIHESIDLGGRITNTYGSSAMYDTLVNLHSGPRVQGEAFELRALPGTKGGPVDYLKAFSTGFGGDPYNYAKLDFSKGKLYEFSGMFRRDRQYFDYDLLGNPNIPNQSIKIGPASAPTGSLPWQISNSPFLFNTVRRMTDTDLTLLPLAKVTFRAGYSQNIFQGPTLSPSGYFFAGSSDVLLQEMQRNSTDDFRGSVEWKPLPQTRLTYEEQITHYKGDSYFTLNPGSMNVQEADGNRVALLAAYDSLTAPTATTLCNASATPMLTGGQTPGSLPVVNPACAVISSYQRLQPTRAIFPTEIFRLQSSSLKNVTMSGDVRYTKANMNLPSFYDSFQGLTKAASATVAANRALTYTGDANAKRDVIAVDYGITWQASDRVSISEQVDYSNAHQPGTSNLTSGTTVATATGAANQNINTLNLTTTTAAAGSEPWEGSAGINAPTSGYFGQKLLTNNLTGSWDISPRTTLSLTWRYGTHTAHYNLQSLDGAIDEPQVDVTVHENGGILNAAFRPATNWTINGTLEMIYHDSVFTPVEPRQTQHYKLRTAFKPKQWATISGAYNDLERHNNTNNTGAVSIYGPLQHVDHSRVGSVGAVLAPNEHYGLEFNYSYSDVYASTNTCYTGIQTAGFAAAAPANGSVCYNPSAGTSNVTLRGGGAYEFGPVKDFMDAPTQFGTVAVNLSPMDRLHSSIGYTVSSVNGSRWFNEARDVNGSLVSTYQSPFVNIAYTVRKGLIWNGAYNYYGYGEGGPSGAQYCAAANPTTTSSAPGAPLAPVNVVACSSLPNTALSGPTYGYTAPRNFHANNIMMGFHYEF